LPRWRGTVPQFRGELVDFRDGAITAAAVARCIVSRRANRDIDEMPRRRLSMLRPYLIGPISDIRESSRVLDIEKRMDLPSRFRFEILFGDFCYDAVAFGAPSECSTRYERCYDKDNC